MRQTIALCGSSLCVEEMLECLAAKLQSRGLIIIDSATMIDPRPFRTFSRKVHIIRPSKASQLRALAEARLEKLLLKTYAESVLITSIADMFRVIDSEELPFVVDHVLDRLKHLQQEYGIRLIAGCTGTQPFIEKRFQQSATLTIDLAKLQAPNVL
ncbi:hypothetical protein GF342_05610 [Candidatus Woesearchaeota archaeon]|nr:hypothetical protein [Candidatus Woesearchaeota archaeon]